MRTETHEGTNYIKLCDDLHLYTVNLIEFPHFIEIRLPSLGYEIEGELSYNRQELEQYFDERLPKLTSSQRIVYDAVIDAVSRNEGGAFFLDARGGTGKNVFGKYNFSESALIGIM